MTRSDTLQRLTKAKNNLINKNITGRKKHSSRRICEYYNWRKQLCKKIISSLINVDNDNRPYIRLNILDKNYFALLDCGANVNVIGSELYTIIINGKQHTYEE